MEKNKIVNHGFLPDKIEPDHYVLGAKQLPEEVIRPDGQWDDFLPAREIQRKNDLETMNCSNYGTLNALETLQIALYGEEKNWAERYLGVMSETTKEGNSPHKVAETIRNESGCIPESILPFDDSIERWEQYYHPKPMTQNYISVGQQWLDYYEFGHEWVTPNSNNLMEALTLSPLGISVFAWQYRNGLYWKNPSDGDNHWVCLYGYVKGKHWKVYDSYDDTTKELEWNYNFNFSKRYYLKKKEANIMTIIREKLSQIYNELLMREPDESADGYLNHDEDFVREAIGKSPERWQLIAFVNWGRAFKIINLFKTDSFLGKLFKGRK